MAMFASYVSGGWGATKQVCNRQQCTWHSRKECLRALAKGFPGQTGKGCKLQLFMFHTRLLFTWFVAQHVLPQPFRICVKRVSPIRPPVVSPRTHGRGTSETPGRPGHPRHRRCLGDYKHSCRKKPFGRTLLQTNPPKGWQHSIRTQNIVQTNVGGAHEIHRLVSTSGRTKCPPRRWKSENFASASTSYGTKHVRNRTNTSIIQQAAEREQRSGEKDGVPRPTLTPNPIWHEHLRLRNPLRVTHRLSAWLLRRIAVASHMSSCQLICSQFWSDSVKQKKSLQWPC